MSNHVLREEKTKSILMLSQDILLLLYTMLYFYCAKQGKQKILIRVEKSLSIMRDKPSLNRFIRDLHQAFRYSVVYVDFSWGVAQFLNSSINILICLY